jgi:hypothetical protein
MTCGVVGEKRGKLNPSQRGSHQRRSPGGKASTGTRRGFVFPRKMPPKDKKVHGDWYRYRCIGCKVDPYVVLTCEPAFLAISQPNPPLTPPTGPPRLLQYISGPHNYREDVPGTTPLMSKLWKRLQSGLDTVRIKDSRHSCSKTTSLV